MTLQNTTVTIYDAKKMTDNTDDAVIATSTWFVFAIVLCIWGTVSWRAFQEASGRLKIADGAKSLHNRTTDVTRNPLSSTALAHRIISTRKTRNTRKISLRNSFRSSFRIRSRVQPNAQTAWKLVSTPAELKEMGRALEDAHAIKTAGRGRVVGRMKQFVARLAVAIELPCLVALCIQLSGVWYKGDSTKVARGLSGIFVASFSFLMDERWIIVSFGVLFVVFFSVLAAHKVMRDWNMIYARRLAFDVMVLATLARTSSMLVCVDAESTDEPVRKPWYNSSVSYQHLRDLPTIECWGRDIRFYPLTVCAFILLVSTYTYSLDYNFSQKNETDPVLRFSVIFNVQRLACLSLVTIVASVCRTVPMVALPVFLVMLFYLTRVSFVDQPCFGFGRRVNNFRTASYTVVCWIILIGCVSAFSNRPIWSLPVALGGAIPAWVIAWRLNNTNAVKYGIPLLPRVQLLNSRSDYLKTVAIASVALECAPLSRDVNFDEMEKISNALSGPANTVSFATGPRLWAAYTFAIWLPGRRLASGETQPKKRSSAAEGDDILEGLLAINTRYVVRAHDSVHGQDQNMGATLANIISPSVSLLPLLEQWKHTRRNALDYIKETLMSQLSTELERALAAKAARALTDPGPVIALGWIPTLIARAQGVSHVPFIHIPMVTDATLYRNLVDDFLIQPNEHDLSMNLPYVVLQIEILLRTLASEEQFKVLERNNRALRKSSKINHALRKGSVLMRTFNTSNNDHSMRQIRMGGGTPSSHQLGEMTQAQYNRTDPELLEFSGIMLDALSKLVTRFGSALPLELQKRIIEVLLPQKIRGSFVFSRDSLIQRSAERTLRDVFKLNLKGQLLIDQQNETPSQRTRSLHKTRRRSTLMFNTIDPVETRAIESIALLNLLGEDRKRLTSALARYNESFASSSINERDQISGRQNKQQITAFESSVQLMGETSFSTSAAVGNTSSTLKPAEELLQISTRSKKVLKEIFSTADKRVSDQENVLIATRARFTIFVACGMAKLEYNSFA